MKVWLTSVRTVAILVLLLTGVELVACDLISPDICQLQGTTRDTEQASGCDTCLCCCTHLAIPSVVPISPAERVMCVLPLPSALELVAPPTSIYHPPRPDSRSLPLF